MENNFIENATLGKNKWWQYVLTFLSVIAAIAGMNVIIRILQPTIKPLFQESEFGNILRNNIYFLLIFGVTLIVFMICFKKLHKRSPVSLINNQQKFSWKLYFKGLIIWSVIMLIYGLFLSDFKLFQGLTEKVSVTYFCILVVTGLISIGIQSFFEEIMLRGYFLQGLHLRVKNLILLIFINSLFFGLLHFGYGLGSFLSSWLFGIAMVIIVIFQNRIEFVSGVHNANNLIIALFFWNIKSDEVEKTFFSVDWYPLLLRIIILTILVGLSYKYFRNLK
jgi:membrane protease YdiL (CAAX protease family)